MDALAQAVAQLLQSTTLVYGLSFAVTLGSMVAAMLLFAWRLERRERFALRVVSFVAVCALLVLIGAALLLPATLPESPSNVFSYGLQLALFSALLALAVGMIAWLFVASPWTALFCCSAGYTLQNFSSGLAELVWAALEVGGITEGFSYVRIARVALNIFCVAIVYVPFYLIFVKDVSREALEQVDDRKMLAIMAVVALGVIGFDLVIKSLWDEGLPFFYLVALRCAHLIMCALTYSLEYELLISRRLEVERQTTEQVLAERERQYLKSRESVEAINVKCHDIRHQIRRLADGDAQVDPEVLRDISREVDVYDSHVETGNEALDTILSEKSLMCSRANITLSCVADGAALDFMAPADIYSLFGNALDNAIEAVEALPDPELRSISLVVRMVAGVVSIHVENYYDGQLARRADGSLETSKADHVSHGFGVRSMTLTVERYGGTLTTIADGRVFALNAIIPVA